MIERIPHSGAWGVAALMIVGASWFVYRFLAPKSWREWAGAGLVQAFIIALYAEMYGFPLTMYLLARFFGLDRGRLDANLWATLLGVGELGMLLSMIAGYVLVAAGIGLSVQGWRELYRARREGRGWSSASATRVAPTREAFRPFFRAPESGIGSSSTRPRCCMATSDASARSGRGPPGGLTFPPWKGAGFVIDSRLLGRAVQD